MMDFLKLNNLPQVSPVQGYDGSGPATYVSSRALIVGQPNGEKSCSDGGRGECRRCGQPRAAGPTCAAWTATHRENRSRQLVIVQELRNDRLTELRSLAAISSPHVARLLAGLELRAHSRSAHQTPGTAYIAGFLEQLMHGLGGARRDWTRVQRMQLPGPTPAQTW
ncbi:hypothetical protein G3M48_002520, partial [Beauveria asiatica]